MFYHPFQCDKRWRHTQLCWFTLEFLSFLSQDIDIDEPSLDSAGPSTSSVSFNMDASPGEDSHQSDMTIRSDGPIQSDKSFDRGRDVGEPQHNRSDKKSPGKKRG